MSVIDTNTWRSYIYEQMDVHNEIYASSMMLGSLIFRSKRPASDSLALWNSNKLEGRTSFSKLSIDKQLEIVQNVVIKLPFTFNKPVNLSDILTLNDTSGGSAHILGFLSCVRQTFPVYRDVPTHIKIAENYIRNLLQNAFKAQFSSYVHIVNDVCYVSGGILNCLACDDYTHWKYVNDATAEDLKIYDINGEGWNLSVFEREYNNWCSFALNARRSILKDFSLHPNCVCSNIATVSTQELNRRSVANDQVSHLITVYDIQKTIDDLKSKLCETETIDILNALLV